MKITTRPTVVPTPPPTYVLELTEDEMLALRSLAFGAGAVQHFALDKLYAGRSTYGTDGKPRRISETLQVLWLETNKFIDTFRERL